MYERFTDRARKVLRLAEVEAKRLHHEFVGSEHILLGLVKEGDGTAANVLKNSEIDLRKIRVDIEQIVQVGVALASGNVLPQTPLAKKVLESARDTARDLNHDYVGTEHLLLGLLRVPEGVAARVLGNLGLNF